MSVNMLFSVMSLISAPVTIFTVPCFPGPPLSRIDKVLTKVKVQTLSGWFSICQTTHPFFPQNLVQNQPRPCQRRNISWWKKQELHKNILAALSWVYHYTKYFLKENFLSTSAKCMGKIKYNKIPWITL